jgi:hypothetical protein
MVLEDDEFTKILLEKIIQNVTSCLPVIENISKVQHQKIKVQESLIYEILF